MFDFFDAGTKKIDKITLGGEDISLYRVVCPASCSPSVGFAARELCRLINEISSKPVSICDDTVPPSGHELVIGDAAREMPVINESFGDDGFAIISQGKSLYISGSPVRGVLYGVYTFAEKYLGFRFFTSDCTCVENREVIDIPGNIRDIEIPIFEWRDVCCASYWDEGIACRRKINSGYERRFSPEMGGDYRYSGRFVHTMESLLGVPQNEQPCFCSEENFDRCLEGIKKLLSENPDTRIISVTQNDNSTFCTCDKCRAVDEEEDSHAGSLLRFVNRLAEVIEKDYPHASIMTLAYLHTKKPPKLTRPRKNVIIEYAPMESCYTHALTDEVCPVNRSLMRDFEDWGKIAKRIYIWDYCADFSFTAAIFPDFHVLRQNMRYYAENNVRGMFCEADNYGRDSRPTDLAELRSYLLSRLLWEPYMTEAEYERHMLEFLCGYYGRGGVYIKEYLDLVEKALVDDRHHFDCYVNPQFLFRPTKLIPLLGKMREKWDAATAESTDDIRAERIRVSRLSFDFIELLSTFDGIMSHGTEEEKARLLRENEDFYKQLVKINFKPRGMSSTLPVLTDMTQNTAAKIYW